MMRRFSCHRERAMRHRHQCCSVASSASSDTSPVALFEKHCSQLDKARALLLPVNTATTPSTSSFSVASKRRSYMDVIGLLMEAHMEVATMTTQNTSTFDTIIADLHKITEGNWGKTSDELGEFAQQCSSARALRTATRELLGTGDLDGQHRNASPTNMVLSPTSTSSLSIPPSSLLHGLCKAIHSLPTPERPYVVGTEAYMGVLRNMTGTGGKRKCCECGGDNHDEDEHSLGHDMHPTNSSMLSRKQLETERIGDLVRRLRLGLGCTHTFDIGAGKGHLGESLSSLFRIPCCSIDRDPAKHTFATRVYDAKNTDDTAMETAVKMTTTGRRHPKHAGRNAGGQGNKRPKGSSKNSGTGVFYGGLSGEDAVHSHLFKNLSHGASVADLAPTIGQKPSLVVGLHTCGPLADIAANIASTSNASGYLNVPCCLPKLISGAAREFYGAKQRKRQALVKDGVSATDAEKRADEEFGAAFKFSYTPRSILGAQLGLGELIDESALHLANLSHQRSVEEVVQWARVKGMEYGLRLLYDGVTRSVSVAGGGGDVSKLQQEVLSSGLPSSATTNDELFVVEGAGTTGKNGLLVLRGHNRELILPKQLMVARVEEEQGSRCGGKESQPKRQRAPSSAPQRSSSNKRRNQQRHTLDTLTFPQFCRAWSSAMERLVASRHDDGGSRPAASRKNLVPNEQAANSTQATITIKIALTDEELEAFWCSPAVQQYVMSCLMEKMMVDATIGYSSEVCVLLDRAFGLAEKGYWVSPMAILPQTASVRNLGLLAVHRKAADAPLLTA